MQHVFDIFDYDEAFLNRFSQNTIPFYDLWTVSTLQNHKKLICSGTNQEIEQFRACLEAHSQLEFPPELVVTIGNAEKGNPSQILNNTKKYFKLRFDKNQSNDLGQPFFPYASGRMPESTNPFGMPYPGLKPMAGLGGFGGFGGLGNGMSMQDLQGVIEKNVSDATRSIKAEYDEMAARREAESIKRLAELEMKMELYKLELRSKEVEERERSLQEQLDEFEARKAEGLGTVKEYTKTIAGGLLELGKTAFGLGEIEDRIKKPEKAAHDYTASHLRGAELDEDGFKANANPAHQPTSDEAFGNLLGAIQQLSVEQKMQLMDVLIPDEAMDGAESGQENFNPQNTNDHEDLQNAN